MLILYRRPGERIAVYTPCGDTIWITQHDHHASIDDGLGDPLRIDDNNRNCFLDYDAGTVTIVYCPQYIKTPQRKIGIDAPKEFKAWREELIGKVHPEETT